MEETEDVQPPMVSIITCGRNEGYRGYDDLFWESPLPPPREHTGPGKTSSSRGAYAQQLSDMQQQLSCVIQGQKALHAQIMEYHTTVKTLVPETAGGTSMDGAHNGGRHLGFFARGISPGGSAMDGAQNGGRHLGIFARGFSPGGISTDGARNGSHHLGVFARGISPDTSTTPRSRGNILSNSRQLSARGARPRAVLPFQKQLMKSRTGDIEFDRIDHMDNMPSRNSFGSKIKTRSDDMQMLLEIFRIAETHHDANAEDPDKPHVTWQRNPSRSSLGRHSNGIMLDSFFGTVILLNAIFIGIRMDQTDAKHFVWTAIDIGFTGLFLFEIGYRVWTQGFCKHFCSSSRAQNVFDAGLVLVDIIQQVVDVLSLGESDGSGVGPSASVFRIGRLGRLPRLLHMLRLSIFTELFTMLQGLFGGLSTLGWAAVLFTGAIYIVALCFREFFGKGDIPNVTELFNSVPRSMFTTFRCSFGDCNSSRGVPIFEYVNAEYGGLACLLYCSFLFLITVGLFNVISAIFVESTMEAASATQMQKKKERLQDEVLWCTNVSVLIKRLMDLSGEGGSYETKLTSRLREVYLLEVSCSIIDELAQDPEAIAALSALDIASEDREFLSDILDPDNGGTINVIEIVEGLRMLRGEPRRSDIVTINLMLRSVQRDIAEMYDRMAKT